MIIGRIYAVPKWAFWSAARELVVTHSGCKNDTNTDVQNKLIWSGNREGETTLFYSTIEKTFNSVQWHVICTSDFHIFAQKFSNALKIPGARRLTYRQFHSEDPQTLGANVQNLFAWVTWRLGFVQPWLTLGIWH